MNWQQLEKEIESKKFCGACLLYGDEEHLKDAVIKRTININVADGMQDLNVSKIAVDDIEKIKESADMLPFMAEKRIVIVDSYKKFYVPKGQYKSEDMKAAVEQIGEIADKKNSDAIIFFLCRGKVDAANPLFKVFKSKDLEVSYNKITEKEKAEVLKKTADENGMDISISVINFLIKFTGGDLLMLENELAKLQAYKKGAITAKDVERVCHASADYNVFNMIKAIDAKREHEALRILKDMLRGGEYIGGIVSLIERQYRTYAFIEDMQSEFGGSVNYAEMEKRIGVKSFVIEKMYKQGLRIEKEKRDKILRMCTDADYLAKRGKINDEAALENLVINLMAQ
ncbi:MAG: DNA polymerase III subunit delta [Eubacteriales bacterium]